MYSIAKIIISIFTLAMATCLIFKNNKPKTKHYKLFDKLDKYNNLNALHNNLMFKISLFTDSHEVASNYAYFFIFSYVFVVILATMFISFLNYIWYIKVIEIILMIILPYTIIKSFINIKYNSVKKQIPIAIGEFQYWFFRTGKVSDALRETSQRLKGSIANPFQMCYYNMSKGETFAIKMLKDTFKDDHMDTFCQLLLVYVENGGSPKILNTTLTELSTQINLDISFSQKQKNRFLKYKIGAIILAAFTIIIKKYLGQLFDESMQADSMMTIILLVFFAIYFFFIDLLEQF